MDNCVVQCVEINYELSFKRFWLCISSHRHPKFNKFSNLSR